MRVIFISSEKWYLKFQRTPLKPTGEAWEGGFLTVKTLISKADEAGGRDGTPLPGLAGALLEWLLRGPLWSQAELPHSYLPVD